MKVTNTELEKMLEEQNKLNGKFSSEWRNTVLKEEIFTAVFTEVAEFLESSPEQWKWWKRKYLSNDTQNQYIEIVDVIHFGLSYMMYDRTNDEILKENNFTQLCKTNIFYALEEFRMDNSLENFYNLVHNMTEYSGLNSEKLLGVYFEKLAINHKRVDGGYAEGTYQKIDADGNEDNRAINI